MNVKFSATNAFDTKLEKIDTSLIAVQGPKAAAILQNGTSEDLSDIFFMQGIVFIKLFCDNDVGDGCWRHPLK